MRRTLIRVAGILAVAVSAASGAMAQTSTFQNAPATEQNTSQGISNTAKTGQQAQQNAGIEGGPDVTYAQVMQNPDDPALNAAYARTQIRKGDLLGASTTLERILLSHPEIVDIRLLYAVVLYRLDDPTTALAQLQALDPATLTPAQRAQRDSALDLVQQKLQVLHQFINVAIGTHFDTDRNASPSSNSVLVGDTAIPLQGSNRQRADWGNLAQFNYGAEYDLGTDPKSSVYGNLTLLGDRQVTVSTLDSNIAGAEAGYRRDFGANALQIGMFDTFMTLNSRYYLQDYGPLARVVTKQQANIDTFVELRVDRQVFHNSTTVPNATDYSGTAPAGWAGVTWRINDRHTLTASAGLTQKHAEQDFQSYRREAFRLSDTWVLDHGQFFVLGGEAGNSSYTEPELVYSANTRRDRDIRLDLTYGVPISTIADLADIALPPEASNVVLSLNGEYYRDISSVSNYTYDNFRTMLLLSKRWEF